MGTGLAFNLNRPKEYILAWPGDEPHMQVCWDSRVTFIPGRSATAEQGKGRWRWPAARTPEGKAIPGTVVIRDEYEHDPLTGTVKKIFDALDYCRGLSTQTPVMMRGLIIMDDVAKLPGLWPEARRLWEEAQDRDADNIVREEMDRINLWKLRGQPAPPPDQARAELITRAMDHLNRRREALKGKSFDVKELEAALERTTFVPRDDLDQLRLDASRKLAAQASEVEVPSILPNPGDVQPPTEAEVAQARKGALRTAVDRTVKQHKRVVASKRARQPQP